MSLLRLVQRWPWTIGYLAAVGWLAWAVEQIR